MAKADRERKGADGRGLTGLLETAVPEVVKKALYMGVGAAFMTEEGIRKILGEIEIPRDAIQYMVNQSDRTKEQVFGVVQTEVRNFLDRLDLSGTAKQILDGMTLELTTTITFRDKGPPKTRVAVVRRLGAKKRPG